MLGVLASATSLTRPTSTESTENTGIVSEECVSTPDVDGEQHGGLFIYFFINFEKDTKSTAQHNTKPITQSILFKYRVQRNNFSKTQNKRLNQKIQSKSKKSSHLGLTTTFIRNLFLPLSAGGQIA